MSDTYMGEFIVKFPNADKGKKMCPVKDTQERTWFVYKDKMAGIVPNAVVRCSYQVGEPKGNDPAPYFVKEIMSVGPQTVPPASAPAPVAAYVPSVGAQPEPTPAASAAAPSHIQDTAEEIYLTGIVGRTMAGLAQSGNFTVDELCLAMGKLTDSAIRAWRSRGAV